MFLAVGSRNMWAIKKSGSFSPVNAQTERAILRRVYRTTSVTLRQFVIQTTFRNCCIYVQHPSNGFVALTHRGVHPVLYVTFVPSSYYVEGDLLRFMSVLSPSTLIYYNTFLLYRVGAHTFLLRGRYDV